MPRNPEPSLEMKKLIWDIAATVGRDKLTDIRRQVDIEIRKQQSEEDKDPIIMEDTPDTRTIERIINEDLDKLPPEVVVAKLPPHVWHLRKDYEEIKRLANRTEESKVEGMSQYRQHCKELAKVAEKAADEMWLPFHTDCYPNYEEFAGEELEWVQFQSSSVRWQVYDKQIHLWAESDRHRWNGLIAHLDTEYPGFRNSFEEWRRMCTVFVSGKHVKDIEASLRAKTDEIYQQFRFVALSKTLKGQCDICRTW